MPKKIISFGDEELGLSFRVDSSAVQESQEAAQEAMNKINAGLNDVQTEVNNARKSVGEVQQSVETTKEASKLLEIDVARTVQTAGSLITNMVSGIRTVFRTFGKTLDPTLEGILGVIQAAAQGAISAAQIYTASGNPYLMAIGLGIISFTTATSAYESIQAITRVQNARIINLMNLTRMQNTESQVRAMLRMVGRF